MNFCGDLKLKKIEFILNVQVSLAVTCSPDSKVTDRTIMRGGPCVYVIDAWCSHAFKADVQLLIKLQAISSPSSSCCYCLHTRNNYLLSVFVLTYIIYIMQPCLVQ